MTLEEALRAPPSPRAVQYHSCVKRALDTDVPLSPPLARRRRPLLLTPSPRSPVGDGMAELRQAQALKYASPEQWAAWPFYPRQTGSPRLDSTRAALVPASPPAELPPPFGVRLETHAIVVGWQAAACGASTSAECGASMSAGSGAPTAGGRWIYELEATELCPIDGRQPPAIVYRGGALEHTIGELLPLSEMCFRVRSCRGGARGPWSAPVVLATLDEAAAPQREPVSTLPDEWRARLDVADLCRAEERRTGVAAAAVELALLAALEHHVPSLKIVFRFYSLQGASGSTGSTDDAPNALGMGQWIAFARAMGMPTKLLHPGQLIFTRAVRALPAGTTSVAAAVEAAVSDVCRVGAADGAARAVATATSAAASLVGVAAAKKTASALRKKSRGAAGKAKRAAAAMEQPQFIGGLVRLAALLLQGASRGVDAAGEPLSLAEALKVLLDSRLAPHVANDLDLAHDCFADVYAGRLMRVVHRKHRARMAAVFEHYASLEKNLATMATGHEASTMDISETATMCDELALLDAKFGPRELVATFVKVNLDDELYEHGEAGNVPSELVFDEFSELVARVFAAREARAALEGEVSAEEAAVPAAEAEEGRLEKAYHAWLGDVFLPRGEAAIKDRKKAKKG